MEHARALTPGPPLKADDFAARLRGFGPVGLAAMAVILGVAAFFTLGGALLVLAWARRSRTPWAAIGFVRPASWARTVVTGIVLGAALKLLMKSVVMPLLGAPPVNEAYRFLAGNPGALPGMLFAVILGAGFGEETLWRGYLFERLGHVLRGPWGRAAIVLGVSILFGLAHVPVQGVPGAQQATITGLVFGTIYGWRGQLPMLMIAHAAFDVVAVTLIYLGLETAVARWFFR